ncbi:uncharacterized protein LOC114577681 isoform X6 [Apis cerana]|uniref:uncharacterized protein LOC114577681 isoform X6 n=1 Tax=Apis cerana TaxID=7461 RepID=UPI002B22332A|nr:uncharacterized protein LOC114577681 isoform X6 [Apis cerana]
MLLCTKFPVTSNGGISEARGAKQRCDETTLLAKEIREWRCGTGSRARRNVRVSGHNSTISNKRDASDLILVYLQGLDLLPSLLPTATKHRLLWLKEAELERRSPIVMKILGWRTCLTRQ